jgi:hypothetical protein
MCTTLQFIVWSKPLWKRGGIFWTVRSVWDIPVGKPNKLNLKVQAAPEVFGIICISENHLDIQNWKVIFLIRSGKGWGFSPDIPVYMIKFVSKWHFSSGFLQGTEHDLIVSQWM